MLKIRSSKRSIDPTRKSWSCERRVIAKAEHLAKGENPLIVVTSLSLATLDARAFYEDLYCAGNA